MVHLGDYGPVNLCCGAYPDHRSDCERGTWLRRAQKPHRCPVPEMARRGDVWQCDCGRRWTCVNHVTQRPGLTSMRADWCRRWWPWPRRRTS